jgi:hypothetical protein
VSRVPVVMGLAVYRLRDARRRYAQREGNCGSGAFGANADYHDFDNFLHIRAEMADSAA